MSEGVTTISFFAKDNAGNAEPTQSLVIKLDKTPPVIADLSRTPANTNGWNNSDVVASFNATDSLSGFASGTAENGTFTFTQEGSNQVHTFTVTDLAGNSASASISDVNIDKTPPIIGAVASPAPNANGWNKTNVTVSFNSSDGLSGIDTSSAPVTLTNEGASQIVTGTAMDRAGNTASVNRSINIDKTAPEIFIQFEPVSKNLQVFGRDSLSGVPAGAVLPLAATLPGGQDNDAGGTTDRRTYQILDLAGNTLVLVLKTQAEGHELKAALVSLEYESVPVMRPPKNSLEYEWEIGGNGILTELEQKLKINSGRDEQEVDGEFSADRNQTVITTKPAGATIVRPGLVLLRLASDHGRLLIEY